MWGWPVAVDRLHHDRPEEHIPTPAASFPCSVSYGVYRDKLHSYARRISKVGERRMWFELPDDWGASLDALDRALHAPREPWNTTPLDLPALAHEISDWYTGRLGQNNYWAGSDWRTFEAEVAAAVERQSIGPQLRTLVGSVANELRVTLHTGGTPDSVGPIAQQLLDLMRHDTATVAAWDDLVSAADPLDEVDRFRRLRNQFVAIATLNGHAGGTDSTLETIKGVVADQALSVYGAQISLGQPAKEPSRSNRLAGMDRGDRLLLARNCLHQSGKLGHNVVWVAIEGATTGVAAIQVGQVAFHDAARLRATLDQRAPSAANLVRRELPHELAVNDDIPSWFPAPEQAGVLARVDLGQQSRIATATADALELLDAVLELFVGADRNHWDDRSGLGHYVDDHLVSVHRGQLTKTPRKSWFDTTSYFLGNAATHHGATPLVIGQTSGRVLSRLSALHAADKDSAARQVVAAVELLECINSAVSEPNSEWWTFAGHLLRDTWVLDEAVDSLVHIALNMQNRDRRQWLRDPDSRPDLDDLVQTFTSEVNGGVFNIHRDAIVEGAGKLVGLFERGSLARVELAEAARILSPSTSKRRLSTLGSRFDLLIARARRCRNAAAHGWPISATAASSAVPFLSRLAERTARDYLLYAVLRPSSPAFEFVAAQARARTRSNDIAQHGLRARHFAP